MRLLLLLLALSALPATAQVPTDLQADLDYIAEQAVSVNRLSEGLRITADGAALLWTTRITGTTRIPADAVEVRVADGAVGVRCADGTACIEGLAGASEGARFAEFSVYPALSERPETAEVARRLRAVLERVGALPQTDIEDDLVAAVDLLIERGGAGFEPFRGAPRASSSDQSWEATLLVDGARGAWVRCSDASCVYLIQVPSGGTRAVAFSARFAAAHPAWVLAPSTVDGVSAFFSCGPVNRAVVVSRSSVSVTAGAAPGYAPDVCAGTPAPAAPSATGCVSGTCTTGTGTWRFASGNTYTGAWRDGKRNGHGTVRYADGDTYVGVWRDNKRHGFGTYTWTSGNTFTGDWVDGSRVRGVNRYADGRVYDGAYSRDDKRHGQGTMTHPDGRVETGTWSDNALVASATPTPSASPSGDARPPIPATGTGCLVGDCRDGYGAWRNDLGTTYAGDFRDGERHGQGVYVFPGLRRYEGEFQNGHETGRGVEIRSDGTRSEGRFVRGKAEGEHLVTYPSGATYRGTFRGGRYEGIHTIELPNGETVRQRFADGAFAEVLTAPGDPVGSQGGVCITAWCWSGEGTMRFPNGRHYIGEWRDGKPHGAGAVVEPDGSYQMGRFAEGRVVEGSGDIMEAMVQARVLSMVEAFREAEGIAPAAASTSGLLDALAPLLEAARTDFVSLRGAPTDPASDGRPTWAGTLRPDGFDIASTSCRDGVCEYTLYPAGYEFLSEEETDALADDVATRLPEWQRIDAIAGGAGGADFVSCGALRHRVSATMYGLTVMTGAAADFDLPACSR